jgi:hypothetical protein
MSEDSIEESTSTMSDPDPAGTDSPDLQENGFDLRSALDTLEEARTAADSGDPTRAVRTLRSVPEGLPLGYEASFRDMVAIVSASARLMGFTGLVDAAEEVLRHPDRVESLYDYGYRCVEHDVPWLAVPALALAVSRSPESTAPRMELVSALEAEARHGEAVTVLAHGPTQELWLGRYLLAFNCLLAGDVEGARQWHTTIGEPEHERHERLARRLTAMLERVTVLTGSTRLEENLPSPDPRGVLSTRDVRGWHFVLNAGILTTLSPYGFSDGMNGRYAYFDESFGGCRRGLERVSTVLGAAGRRPGAVALLPDRSSRVLGMAAAELLGLPTVPWSPTVSDALVPVFTMSALDPEFVTGLREATDQVLFEHATCWTEPAPIAADLTTVLTQVITAPWDARRRLRLSGDGWEQEPADDRPESVVSAEVVTAVVDAPEGDGQTPADHEGALSEFVTQVARDWATGRSRDRVWSPGPVPSSRFW